MISGIMSVIVLKKNLIVNPSTIKSFEDQSKVLCRWDICWLIILIDSVLKKMKLLSASVFKRM